MNSKRTLCGYLANKPLATEPYGYMILALSAHYMQLYWQDGEVTVEFDEAITRQLRCKILNQLCEVYNVTAQLGNGYTLLVPNSPASASASAPAPAPTPFASSEEQERLVCLQEWRNKRVNELYSSQVKDSRGRPSVLSDLVLAEIARANPTTLGALLKVKGVGPTKVRKYGEQILAVLERLAAVDCEDSDSSSHCDDSDCACHDESRSESDSGSDSGSDSESEESELKPTGYLLYSQSILDALRQQFPFATIDDLARFSGKKWLALSEEEKETWRERAYTENGKVFLKEAGSGEWVEPGTNIRVDKTSEKVLGRWENDHLEPLNEQELELVKEWGLDTSTPQRAEFDEFANVWFVELGDGRKIALFDQEQTTSKTPIVIGTINGMQVEPFKLSEDMRLGEGMRLSLITSSCRKCPAIATWPSVAEGEWCAKHYTPVEDNSEDSDYSVSSSESESVERVGNYYYYCAAADTWTMTRAKQYAVLTNEGKVRGRVIGTVVVPLNDFDRKVLAKRGWEESPRICMCDVENCGYVATARNPDTKKPLSRCKTHWHTATPEPVKQEPVEPVKQEPVEPETSTQSEKWVTKLQEAILEGLNKPEPEVKQEPVEPKSVGDGQGSMVKFMAATNKEDSELIGNYCQWTIASGERAGKPCLLGAEYPDPVSGEPNTRCMLHQKLVKN